MFLLFKFDKQIIITKLQSIKYNNNLKTENRLL
jgi:hypothetical protein